MRKLPRQQRSKQMVEAILQAAAEVFAELGYARATTNKVAERGGVSVGSLYQYFGNKDSLLAHLLEQHHTEVHRVVDAALTKLSDPEAPLEDGLRQLLSELVGLHQANPAVTKALSAEVSRQSAATADLHKDESHRAEARRVGALLKTRPDVREGDHIAMAAVVGQTTAQLSRWLVHDAPPGMDQAALLEETVLNRGPPTHPWSRSSKQGAGTVAAEGSKGSSPIPTSARNPHVIDITDQILHDR